MKNPVEVYNRFGMMAPRDITDHNGELLAFRNSGKWHACKGSSVPKPGFLCGNGRPTDPSRGDWAKGQFKRNTEVETPREFLEHDRLCQFCHRKVENEFGLKRVIVAASEYRKEDIARFDLKREKEFDQ